MNVGQTISLSFSTFHRIASFMDTIYSVFALNFILFRHRFDGIHASSCPPGPRAVAAFVLPGPLLPLLGANIRANTFEQVIAFILMRQRFEPTYVQTAPPMRAQEPDRAKARARIYHRSQKANGMKMSDNEETRTLTQPADVNEHDISFISIVEWNMFDWVQHMRQSFSQAPRTVAVPSLQFLSLPVFGPRQSDSRIEMRA